MYGSRKKNGWEHAALQRQLDSCGVGGPPGAVVVIPSAQNHQLCVREATDFAKHTNCARVRLVGLELDDHADQQGGISDAVTAANLGPIPGVFVDSAPALKFM